MHSLLFVWPVLFRMLEHATPPRVPRLMLIWLFGSGRNSGCPRWLSWSLTICAACQRSTRDVPCYKRNLLSQVGQEFAAPWTIFISFHRSRIREFNARGDDRRSIAIRPDLSG